MTILGVIAFGLGMLAFIKLSERASDMLTTEQREQLRKNSRLSSVSFLILLAVFGAAYPALQRFPEFGLDIVTAVLAYVVVSNIIGFVRMSRRLKQLQLPDAYQKTYKLGYACMGCGFFLLMFFQGIYLYQLYG